MDAQLLHSELSVDAIAAYCYVERLKFCWGVLSGLTNIACAYASAIGEK